MTIDDTRITEARAQGIVTRIEAWLKTEVLEALRTGGNVKLVVNIDEDGQDLKAVIERYRKL